MLFKFEKKEWLGNEINDLFAGIVSSVAILPEVIGFAIIAGVTPMAALFASFTTLFVISFIGGRPAMVSAAAGSMALVMTTLVEKHGINYMITATILTGILQVIFGYLGIHKLMRFISKTVMYGFVNALAIMIFLAQIQQLPNQTMWAYIMVGLTVFLMYVLPRVTTIVPPALIVICMMTFLSFLFKGHLQTVGDLGNMSTIQPKIAFPIVPLDWHTLTIVFPSALCLSFVGLIESLLTIPIVDQMTNSSGDQPKEVKAQGIANIITGLFGGQAGCAMIGQVVINVKSGGKTRLSTLVSSLFLLSFIFIFKDVMFSIPTAALIGIMITVSFDTFDWESLNLLKTFQLTESFIMIFTIVIVVYTHNLAIGIVFGVLLSGIIYVFKKNRNKSQNQ